MLYHLFHIILLLCIVILLIINCGLSLCILSSGSRECINSFADNTITKLKKAIKCLEKIKSSNH